jgi:hypothetical protein
MIPQQKIKYKETEKRREMVRDEEVSEKARSGMLFPTQGFITYGAVPGSRS